MELIFENYEELRCLHYALCEAKFHPEPQFREVQGSPLSAATADKVYDLLIENAPTEREAQGWRYHRELSPTSPLMPVIENAARRLAQDKSLSATERKTALKVFAAPFHMADHHIENIFERVGGHRPTLW
ncbi:MAG: hypothetical protein KDN20_01615 [Verrucomicrobiae bacterium]|nr:hypothetical protein [Verrucomicrobiae bacterium]